MNSKDTIMCSKKETCQTVCNDLLLQKKDITVEYNDKSQRWVITIMD